MAHHVYIDGMGFIFRAYHGVRSNLTRADGLPTNALFGFAQMLVKVVDDLRPDFCAVVLDSKPPNWRHALYEKYKANRPPPDEALVKQLEFIEPLVGAFGLPTLRVPGFEADDILATLVQQHVGGEADRITIVSSDKDLLQLVRDAGDPVVKLLDTLSDTWRGEQASVEKFGVPPGLVLEVQALMGDSSDNIPGAPGIGPKTAAELVLQFGDVEQVLARAGDIKREKLRATVVEHAGNIRLSRQLASLKTDVPLPDLDLTFKPTLGTAATYVREVLEFKSLAARLEKKAGSGPVFGAVPRAAPGVNSSVLMVAPPGAVVEQMRPAQAPWGSYACVQTAADWATWVAKIERAGLAAWDTETTSLHPHSAELVGISLAVAPGEACYVPLGHVAAGGASGADLFAAGPELLPGQVSRSLVVGQLAAWLRSGKVKLIAHNFKYDVQVLARALGVLGQPAELANLCTHFEDTLLLSACLHGGRWGHGLDSLVQRHLGHSMIPFSSVCGTGKSAITFDRVALDVATAYAAEDADATLRLWLELAPQLAAVPGPQRVYETLEKPVLPVVAGMEAVGVRVDAGALRQLSATWQQELLGLEATIHTAAGRAFNVASPKQLGEVLFDELKLGTNKHQTAKGTGVEVLEALLETTPPEHPGYALVQAVMQHRTLAKLRSTYAEALLHEIHPTTGRVHTSYLQMGAATGRFSSTDPNLQNIPIRTAEGRKVRQAFVPQAGWSMLSADYSQIELRLLAHLSGSPELTRAFNDGLDIHAYTASLIAGVPLEQVSKEQRRAAKFVNFGLVYGMGARSLAGQIGCSVAEAQEWLNAYFARYSGVREYLDSTRAFAKQYGYVETLFNRRVHLPEIHSPNGGLRSNAERAAINAPLQGSNADIIKKAMPGVAALAQAHGAHLLLQVHDELVLEAPPEQVEALKAALIPAMAGVVQLAVPLVVEVGVGVNWDAAH